MFGLHAMHRPALNTRNNIHERTSMMRHTPHTRTVYAPATTRDERDTTVENPNAVYMSYVPGAPTMLLRKDDNNESCRSMFRWFCGCSNIDTITFGNVI